MLGDGKGSFFTLRECSIVIARVLMSRLIPFSGNISREKISTKARYRVNILL